MSAGLATARVLHTPQRWMVLEPGVVLGMVPTKGIPLPFISYGRTSLLTNLAALGIVQSVLLYRLKYRY